MRVTVATISIPFVAGNSLCDKKDIDFTKPGNRKWLLSHIAWATKNNKAVTITPEHS